MRNRSKSSISNSQKSPTITRANTAKSNLDDENCRKKIEQKYNN